MKTHVLLIDDDRDEMDIFMSALTRADLTCKCTYYNDSEQALKMLNYINPDLIFVDLNMPRMGGMECLQHIRENERFSQVPVIIYSTGVDEHLYQRAMALGASACISKTSDLGSLAAKLREIISGQEAV